MDIEKIMPDKSYFVKRIFAKCKCGKPADSIVQGITQSKEDRFLKILFLNCSHCGLKHQDEMTK